MPQPQTTVESFNLDHTQVRAPYVRLAGRYAGPKGDEVRKFDLRLVQPNQAEVPTAALHTIEHLMAGYLRDVLGDTIVDASPMGCRTGFYLTTLPRAAGGLNEEEVKDALASALRAITEHDGPIPGCSKYECGNYRDHSLPGAKAWAADILARDIVVQPTIPLS